MTRLLILVLALAAVWFYLSRPAPLQLEAPPPIIALEAPSVDDPPVQQSLDQPNNFKLKNYEIQTLQAFALTARVLSVETYKLGREADLSPLDIAFGWGRMRDSAVVDRLSISQSGRWYHWRYSGEPPLPRREIETSSANMHMIPASAEVAKALHKLGKGTIVSLRGYLVQAKANDGWTWRSSLTREDTGNGSCELVFVQAVDIH